MPPARTNPARFPFLLIVVLGLVASGLAASVQYAVHVSQAPSSSEFLTDLTPQGDGLSAEERRGLTREMLKARRENPQEPAEVRPTASSRPTDSGPAADPADEGNTADPKRAVRAATVSPERAAPRPTGPAADPADEGNTADPKGAVRAATASPERAAPRPTGPAADPADEGKGTVKAATERTSPDRAAPVPIARPAPRARAEAAVAVTPAVPAAAATTSPAAVPPGTTDPAVQAPPTMNASSGTEPAPAARGVAGNVLTSLSTFAGSAANATGNTVNWMINLPGRAMSAGGKLFGGDSSASSQPTPPAPSAGGAPSPATLPPPATAPPSRRNL
ncbi:MAG: hypothetical protein FWD12_12830 [Alphaproteobacteria bacterium]|nr:hypothetical protein [Alphaproteobacteria bacterium]